MVLVSAAAPAPAPNHPGTEPKASVQRRGERVPGPGSEAVDSMFRNVVLLLPLSLPNVLQPSSLSGGSLPPKHCSGREQKLPRPDPRGRVGDHHVHILRKPGFKAQVF